MRSHCPYCNFIITVSDPDADVESNLLARREIEHMQAAHPDVIAERLARMDRPETEPEGRTRGAG
jgi:coproporphyrinogen III oxidase-like Fe-S oxidoreductase